MREINPTAIILYNFAEKKKILGTFLRVNAKICHQLQFSLADFKFLK